MVVFKKTTYFSLVFLVATMLLGNRVAHFMASFFVASGIVHQAKAEEAPKKEASGSLTDGGAPIEEASASSAEKPKEGEGEKKKEEPKEKSGESDAGLQPAKLESAIVEEVGKVEATPLRTLDELDGGVSPEELTMLQKLRTHRQDLARREERLKQREVLLVTVEQRMAQKLEELKKLHGDFTSLRDAANKAIKQVNDQENKRLENLANIYATMPPKKAAVIFDKLDMPVILQILPRLKVAVSNQILSFMDPSKASTITTKLAQSQNAPNTAAG